MKTKTGIVKKEELLEKLENMHKAGIFRINSITGVDVGKEIEIIYHFSREKDILAIKTRVPKEKAQIDTIVDIFPGAIILEQELSEMLGVNVRGNKTKRTFLPDDWPKNNYPLRRDK